MIFPYLKNFIVENTNTLNESHYLYGLELQKESIIHLYGLDKENKIFKYLENTNQKQLQQEIHLPLKNIGKIKINTFNQSISPLTSSINFEIENTFMFTLSIDEIKTKRKIDKKGLLINGNHYTDNNNRIQESIEIEIIIPDLSRLYNRIASLTEYPLQVLNKKKVAIVGLGSGGSLIGLYLAKAGVKDFLLIDEDRFEDHNIIRHICSLNDIGRYKTIAAKDYLLNRIPDLNISTLEESFKIDTINDEEKYRSLLKDYNLIIAATGDHKINMRINQFAYKFGIPVIYAGTFDKIIGGIMIRVDPTMGDTCYSCIYDNRKANDLEEIYNNFNDSEHIEELPKIIATEQPVTYDRSLEDLLSQPGLGIDIDNITIFVVKFILYNLLKDNIDHNDKIFSNNNNKNRQININKKFINNNKDSDFIQFSSSYIFMV